MSVAAVLLAAAAAFVPHLLLAFSSGGAYSGCYYAGYAADFETYLAKMRIPAELGGWLWRNMYDPNFSGPGAPLFLFYAAAGKLARLLGVDYPAMYAALLGVGAAAAAAALTVLAREIGFREPWVPVVAVLGGGLEWLISLLGGFLPGGVGPEVYLSYTAATFPHVALVQAGIIFLFLALRRLPRGSGRPWAAAAGSSALVALIHPEQLAAPLLAELLSGGVRQALRSAAAMAPGLALAAWEALSVLRISWVRAWLAGNAVPPPDPAALVLTLWPPLVSAASGYRAWARSRGKAEARRVLAWAVIPLILAYLPFPGLPDHRGRLLMGFAPWLWLFAAAGLKELRPAIKAVAAGIMLAGPVMFAAVIPATLPPSDRAAFIPRDVAAAYKWLSEHARGELVLADPVDANRLPSRALAKPALAGHWAETPGYREGRRLAEEFFSPATSPARRTEILRASRAKWVLWRADLYGPAGLEAAARPVWRRGEVEIWQVLREGAGKPLFAFS